MTTTTTSNDTFTGTACIDCAMLIANGEAPLFETEAETAAWLDAFSDRNDGIYWAMGDETDDFSSRPCTACGSHLGGSRHEIVGWHI